ncbi:ALDH-like protein [Thozetella sp. PMI_491]|nr:ALDH-like protein [Thozetella sp. PMI_491]
MAQRTIPLVINGRDVVDTESTVFISNPDSTFSPGWTAQGATMRHCEQAIESSARAFQSWRFSTPHERMELFRGLAQLFRDSREALKSVIKEELHCSDLWAEINVNDCIDLAEQLACVVWSGSLSGVVPEVRRGGAHAIVSKQPLGIVLGVAPWNSPAFLALRSVAAPVAAGNCAILKARLESKGSELSPRTHHFIADLFNQANFPPGVVNFLIHRTEDAASIFKALISHPAVRKCNFTGSTAVGRQIAMRAAQYLKPVLLELGGKNFALVLDDSDMDQAASMILEGAFLNSGQICMSTDIVLVSEGKKEAICAALRKRMDSARSAHVTGVIHYPSRARIASLVEDALNKGATLIEGHAANGVSAERAVIIDNLTKDMTFWRQESFGPLLGIATYQTVEEAVAIINSCEYGLSAAIFTTSGLAAMKLASQLEVGGGARERPHGSRRGHAAPRWV